MSVTDNPVLSSERLASLPAHEAFAVYGELLGELRHESEQLMERIAELDGLQKALAQALGNGGAARAGEALMFATEDENEAYLAELVARVKGGEKDA